MDAKQHRSSHRSAELSLYQRALYQRMIQEAPCVKQLIDHLCVRLFDRPSILPWIKSQPLRDQPVLYMVLISHDISQLTPKNMALLWSDNPSCDSHCRSLVINTLTQILACKLQDTSLRQLFDPLIVIHGEAWVAPTLYWRSALRMAAHATPETMSIFWYLWEKRCEPSCYRESYFWDVMMRVGPVVVQKDATRARDHLLANPHLLPLMNDVMRLFFLEDETVFCSLFPSGSSQMDDKLYNVLQLASSRFFSTLSPQAIQRLQAWCLAQPARKPYALLLCLHQFDCLEACEAWAEKYLGEQSHDPDIWYYLIHFIWHDDHYVVRWREPLIAWLTVWLPKAFATVSEDCDKRKALRLIARSCFVWLMNQEEVSDDHARILKLFEPYHEHLGVMPLWSALYQDQNNQAKAKALVTQAQLLPLAGDTVDLLQRVDVYPLCVNAMLRFDWWEMFPLFSQSSVEVLSAFDWESQCGFLKDFAKGLLVLQEKAIEDQHVYALGQPLITLSVLFKDSPYHADMVRHAVEVMLTHLDATHKHRFLFFSRLIAKLRATDAQYTKLWLLLTDRFIHHCPGSFDVMSMLYQQLLGAKKRLSDIESSVLLDKVMLCLVFTQHPLHALHPHAFWDVPTLAKWADELGNSCPVIHALRMPITWECLVDLSDKVTEKRSCDLYLYVFHLHIIRTYHGKALYSLPKKDLHDVLDRLRVSCGHRPVYQHLCEVHTQCVDCPDQRYRLHDGIKREVFAKICQRVKDHALTVRTFKEDAVFCLLQYLGSAFYPVAKKRGKHSKKKKSKLKKGEMQGFYAWLNSFFKGTQSFLMGSRHLPVLPAIPDSVAPLQHALDPIIVMGCGKDEASVWRGWSQASLSVARR